MGESNTAHPVQTNSFGHRTHRGLNHDRKYNIVKKSHDINGIKESNKALNKQSVTALSYQKNVRDARKTSDSHPHFDLYYGSFPSQTDSNDIMIALDEIDHRSEDMARHGMPDEGFDILDWAIDLINFSPAAAAMLKEAFAYQWTITLSDLGDPDFHIDAQAKEIILNDQGMSEEALGRSPFFRNMLVVSIIRAIRDIWQEKRYGGLDADYNPENVLTLERVRAADLDVTLILIAWELRCEDRGDLWRYLIGAEEGDIAMRFMGFLERDPSSNFTRDALAAAFTQWFRNDDRVNSCDHETLNYLDHTIDTMDVIDARAPFGHRRLTPIAVERLSCLPDRSAYLMGHGASILSDPLYAGMNDDINQAHLLHILHDVDVTYVENVPFRDPALANKIFPDITCVDEDDHWD